MPALRLPRKSTRTVKLPRAKLPTKQEKAYQARLVKLVNWLEGLIVESVGPSLETAAAELAAETPQLARQDSAAEAVTRAFKVLGDLRLVTAELLPAQIAQLGLDETALDVDALGRANLGKMIARLARVQPLISEPWLSTQIDLFRQTNVGLIQGLVDDTFKRVETRVANGFRAGTRPEDMIQGIKDDLGVSTSRARLIARDQVSKLYGQLDKLRQSGLGITKYTWRTARDERVRDRHEELEGKVFAWDDPPVTNSKGERNHPGEDYQCRCYAEPYLQDLLED